MTRPRILMADDHSLVLAGLRKLVEGEGDVVGTVEDGRALVEAAQKLSPDIILLDISMPLLNGLDAARQLTKLVPEAKLIFLTMHATPTYATEAFKAGASGYLIKRSAASELKQAIQACDARPTLPDTIDHKRCPGGDAAATGRTDAAAACSQPHATTAGSPAACGRREEHQGYRLHSSYLGQDRRVSQGSDHGLFGSAFDGRSHQVRGSGGPGRPVTS